MVTDSSKSSGIWMAKQQLCLMIRLSMNQWTLHYLQIQSETRIIKGCHQRMARELEQGTTSDAAKMHALLVEEFDKDDTDDDNTQPTTVYTLFAGDSATKKCLEGIHIPCEPGTLVHNKEMKSTERKYLITLVLDMWDDFHSDKHSSGSYVVWAK